jgi:hypothetical protein
MDEPAASTKQRGGPLPGAPGQLLLALSGAGYPLTQLAIRTAGRRGAVLVEAVCGGLLLRDIALLRTGTDQRLRRGPAALLWLETSAALAAVLAGVRPILSAGARGEVLDLRPSRSEALRRATIGTLFGIHTLRFRIYLRPGRGLRVPH